MNNDHGKGYLGEQTAGFALGAKGYYLVDGPSGSGGHSITASGFDGVAYNPITKHLLIYDNKAFTRKGNISSATAVDPERNLANNLSNLALRIRSIVMPDKDDILKLLEQTIIAIKSGTRWPSNVQIAVSNANGNSTCITAKLAQRGISFIKV